jgi:hypothetical protein
MTDLKNSRVFRGGVTTDELTLETRNCWFDLNQTDQTCDFHFRISSAGGGTTVVLFQLGADDMPKVIEGFDSVMAEAFQ